jgi:hypothetical protein
MNCCFIKISEKPQSKTASSGYSDAQYDCNWTAGGGPSSSTGEQVKVNKYTGEPEVSTPGKTCLEILPQEPETVNKYTGEPLVPQSSHEYTVEVSSNCKKYKPTDKISLKSQRPKLTIHKPNQKVNKYTGEPVDDSVEKQTYTPEARDVPEYNPTPINQLKPSPSKYQTHATENENDQEYDPQSNFSTACILEPSQPKAIKRPFTYDPTTPDFNHPAKKAKGDSEPLMLDSDEDQSDAGDIGTFSDEEEEDEESKHLAMKDEEDSSDENDEEDLSRNAMITDVKVFESLLMPVMAHTADDKETETEKNLSNSKKSSSKTNAAKSEKSSNHAKSFNSTLNNLSKKTSHIPKEKVAKVESLKSSKHSSSSNSSKHSSSSKSKESSSSRTSSSKSLLNGSSKSSEKHKSSHSSSHSSSDKSHKHSHKTSSSSSSASSSHKTSSSSASSKAKSSSDKEASKKHSSSHDHKHAKHSSHDKKSSKSDHSKSSSDKKKKHSGSGHDKQESRSKNLKGTHKNLTEKESKKRDRSVSLDSNGSKRRIVDLNVDLFGADSDMEDDVPALVSDEEEDRYEECLRIYNENIVSKPSPKKQSHRVCVSSINLCDRIIMKLHYSHYSQNSNCNPASLSD